MRKEKMITRTITQTSAQVMAIDVTNSEVSIFETKIGGVYTDIELLKMLKKIYETDTYKLVSIESNKHEEILLGMTESQFFKYATVVITDKRKAVNRMPDELTKLLKEIIKIKIDKKITGKATVNIINDLLIVDIIPRNLNDSIFRCTFNNIDSDIQHGVTSTDYVNAVITKYRHKIYKRYFK